MENSVDNVDKTYTETLEEKEKERKAKLDRFQPYAKMYYTAHGGMHAPNPIVRDPKSGELVWMNRAERRRQLRMKKRGK